MQTLTMQQADMVSGALAGACSPGTMLGAGAGGAFLGAVGGTMSGGPLVGLGGAVLGFAGGAFGAAVGCAIDVVFGGGGGGGGGWSDNGVQCVKVV